MEIKEVQFTNRPPRLTLQVSEPEVSGGRLGRELPKAASLEAR